MTRAGLLTLLLLLASCGGGPRRHAVAARPDQGGGSFMDVTRSRCAAGDDGACRMLRAMGD